MKQKEKTIKDWLNTLDEPYKSKALRQTNEDILNLYCDSLLNSLYQMFDWVSSEEGLEYWSDLTSSLENIEK
jgi:hypothetical protein